MGKKLIVFHSYSGNTRIIVDMIKEKLDCDVLELRPKIPFSGDYQRVVDEYHNNSVNDQEIELEQFDIDINNYDKIILGSPVWWYTITPVIASFLKQNDLSSKIIYPFATNAGWLGHTFKDISKLCQNATISNEMNIVFTSDYKEHKLKTNIEDINNWIEKIN